MQYSPSLIGNQYERDGKQAAMDEGKFVNDSMYIVKQSI